MVFSCLYRLSLDTITWEVYRSVSVGFFLLYTSYLFKITIQTFNIVVGTDGLSENGPVLNPEDKVFHPLPLQMYVMIARWRLSSPSLPTCRSAADMAARQELQSQDNSNEVVNSDSTLIRLGHVHTLGMPPHRL